uniref:Protein kinase domain-containing protein n=1 Tax=Anopheles farauti TaxID=69004 RepID=A0A182QEU9_9DIPT
MHRNMEIRHMAFHLDTLAHILDTSEGWREFLYLIPRNLDDLAKSDYTLKYTGLNESLLETESKKTSSSPSKLLLDEWAISGRERPTVAHLLTLLVRAKQIRAAEYLTTLLREKPPARPSEGPGAPIDVTIPEDHQTESLLNGISYPSSTILQHNVESVTIDNNRDYYDKMCPMKRVEIKENSVSDRQVSAEQPVFSSSNNDTRSGSDSSDIRNPQMLERYPDQVPGPSSPVKGATTHKAHARVQEPPLANDLPMISALGITGDSANQAREVMESSKLQNDRNYGQPNNGNEVEAPNLSIFGWNDSVKEDNIAPGSPRSAVKDIPALSALLSPASDGQQIHSSSTNRTHDSIPMLSMLGSDQSTSNTIESDTSSVASTPHSGDSVSDLIKFSSTTLVLQFSYDQLRTATDGFNPQPYTNGDVNSPDGRSIGAGGFGTVFLTVQLSPAIPVAAVKRLDPDKYKCREKFQLELDILSHHSHPNVVSLLGSSADGPQLCLVYEYLRDGNLETALAAVRTGHRHLPAARRVKYLHDVASAIAFLHDRAEVIHRDVKSANILLDRDVAKLCDFGLIKRTSSRTTTSIIGTNAYMAPEAVRGDVSPSLDIFAFGIVIAETVTGEPVLAEKESRSEIDLAGYLARHRDEGLDLASLVDTRAVQDHGDGERWVKDGRTLLEIALRCMGVKWSRPNAGTLVALIDSARANLNAEN